MDVALSVIIVSWNTREMLRRCLLSVQQTVAASLSAQVVVVDNASADGTADMVRGEFPWVDLLANDRNVGFGPANNLALPLVRGPYVLFLNPDTEVAAGSIETMIRYLNDHAEVGVVGTTLLNPDGTLQPSCHPYYSFLSSLKHNRLVDRFIDRWKISDEQRGSQPAEVDWMTGACLVVRGAILRELGGFDADFFLYGEEIDLQFRIRTLGWGVVYVPSSGVVHYGGQSARHVPLAASFHDYRGRWLFIRKHYSAFSASAYLAKTIMGLGVWLAFWTVRSALGAGPEAERQSRAYWQLLTWHLLDRGRPPTPQLAIGIEELEPLTS